MKLTLAQRKTFFASVRQAASELGEDAEAYRRRILREELGVEHMADVSRTGDFDRLMARICSDRGDYERALAYSQGAVVRIVHLIVGVAEKIVAASPDYDGTAIDYVVGVMAQSKMFERLPATEPAAFIHEMCYGYYKEGQLKRLFMMLGTHLRRKGGAK